MYLGEEMYELKYCMIYYNCKLCPLNRKCEKEIKDREQKKKAVKSGEK